RYACPGCFGFRSGNGLVTQTAPPSPRILVGLAGWSYPDWKGLVYPRESNFDKLRYLSGFFDTIEVNTTFYAIPAPRTVEAWVRSVSGNPRFLFAVKLYKQLTHGDKINQGRPEIQPETVAGFKCALQPLRETGKLGALLLQFPYRFHDESGNRDYLQRLFDSFQDYPLVVEVRHKSFDKASFYAVLRERGVAFANIDQPLVSESLPPTRIFTSPERAYLRFHGRNMETWFAAEAGRDARYDYHYSPEELESYQTMIQEFRRGSGTLYVIFNNHYRAAQVKNALEFLHGITGQPVRVMPALLKAHPELQKIAVPEASAQQEVLPGETYPLFD
ncbi:MAG: DUF72 domain-containing protein, partial [Acidobacteria bacterium]|nr:DUF72 domain-containing protein [Acidobacteriota bacterium]